MTKNVKFVITRFVFSKLKMHQNLLDPAGEAYDAPQNPLVSWGGDTSFPILPPRRLRRLELGASVLRPPQH